MKPTSGHEIVCPYCQYEHQESFRLVPMDEETEQVTKLRQALGGVLDNAHDKARMLVIASEALQSGGASHD